jgi:uncharacterized protein
LPRLGLARKPFPHRATANREHSVGYNAESATTLGAVNASTRLELRVVPGATRPGVVGRHGTSWKVRVAVAPEGGRANDALVRLLAETLGLPRRDVAVVAGHTSRDKVVTVAGISPEETDARLSLSVGAAR